MTRYYAWALKGRVYHDGAYSFMFEAAVPNCDTTHPFAYYRAMKWKHGKKPPSGRDLCKRCAKLRGATT